MATDVIETRPPGKRDLTDNQRSVFRLLGIFFSTLGLIVFFRFNANCDQLLAAYPDLAQSLSRAGCINASFLAGYLCALAGLTFSYFGSAPGSISRQVAFMGAIVLVIMLLVVIGSMLF